MIKLFKSVGLALMLCFGLAACSKVPAGNVGVKVNLLGSDKGVSSEELGPGRYYIGMNEELFLFPTFSQNYTWTIEPDETGNEDESLSFQDRDGLIANADVGITYSIDPTKATKIFEKYRKGISEITDIYLRNMVRDALVKRASSQPLDYLYGPGKSELIDNVQKDVSSQVEKIGIRIEKIYWIGAIRLPKEIADRISEKIGAAQKTMQRRAEVEQTKAEADKAIEEARGISQSFLLKEQATADGILMKAKAQAEANRILSSSITPELVKYKAIETWKGVLPQTITSSLTPILDVGK